MTPTALLLLLAGGAAQASTPSAHESALRAQTMDTFGPRILPSEQQLLEGRMKVTDKVVYGYYPYWAHDLSTIRWDALTHLAWFAVEVNSSGAAINTHGWPDPETVDAAHAANVRVDLAFTLFSGDGIKTLVNDPARREAAVTTMIDLMEQGGADGIAVDFEGFVDGTRAGFVTFITELRAGLDARGHQDAEISMAGPAVDWGDEWDVAALLDSADYFFIMGYDYFWSGSGRAGPSGILKMSPDYAGVTSWTATRSVANYASMVGPDKRRKIIYGVPYYGRQWSTASGSFAATTIADEGSVTYVGAIADLEGGFERKWDDGTKTPWYAFQSGGTWHEVYYDDAESLGYKYHLAKGEELGGIGMWALNYDAPYTELWDVIGTELGPKPAAEGSRGAPIEVDAFPFHDARDTREGPSQYFNVYSCDTAVSEYGKEWVYAVDVCQPGTIEAHVPELADADPDVHLLSDLEEAACLARGHTDLSFDITPGRYYVVVDTFVTDSGLELEGAFDLDVDFAPEPGSAGCAEGEVCDAGNCVIPGEGGGGGGPGPAGAGGGGATAAVGVGGGAADDGGEDDGCSCRLESSSRSEHDSFVWLGAAALAAAAIRRRTSRRRG